MATFVRKDNDCLTACLAVLTGLAYRDCFHAYADGVDPANWRVPLAEWGSRHGYIITWGPLPDYSLSVIPNVTIAVGPSPEGSNAHAVLVSWDNGDKIVYDPKDGGSGLLNGQVDYYVNVTRKES